MSAGSKRILVLILLVIVTALLSLLPEARIDTITHTSYNYYVDLLQHSLYYVALTIVCCWVFPEQKPWVVAVVLFGLSFVLEVGQHFMPERTFSIHDIFMNFAGTTTGFLLVTWRRYSRQRLA